MESTTLTESQQLGVRKTAVIVGLAVLAIYVLAIFTLPQWF